MTVSELIERLTTFNPDLRVMVDGYEDGYEDLVTESFQLEASIHLNRFDEWYYGPHGECHGGSCAPDSHTNALVLARGFATTAKED